MLIANSFQKSYNLCLPLFRLAMRDYKNPSKKSLLDRKCHLSRVGFSVVEISILRFRFTYTIWIDT